MGATAACSGASFSSRRSRLPKTASRSPRACTACSSGRRTSETTPTRGASITGILGNTRFAAAPAGSVRAVHLFSEAGKLAYADRARYLGDPDFVTVPVERLLSRGYLRERAKLIGERAMRHALPGDREAGTS